MAIKRNAEGKIVLKHFSVSKLEKAAAANSGFCRRCGAQHEQIEPDARRYECKTCHGKSVYGAEEIAAMQAF